jgi:hypothetical protein
LFGGALFGGALFGGALFGLVLFSHRLLIERRPIAGGAADKPKQIK